MIDQFEVEQARYACEELGLDLEDSEFGFEIYYGTECLSHQTELSDVHSFISEFDNENDVLDWMEENNKYPEYDIPWWEEDFEGPEEVTIVT